MKSKQLNLFINNEKELNLQLNKENLELRNKR